MWIATKLGFFSIVRAHAEGQPKTGSHLDKVPHDHLMMVRARDRRHLEALVDYVVDADLNYIFDYDDIVENKGTDYPYRIIMGEEEEEERSIKSTIGMENPPHPFSSPFLASLR